MSSFDSFLVKDAAESKGLFTLSPSAGPANVLNTSAGEFVKTHRAAIDQAVEEHGVILFRGFPLNTTSAMNEFICAFDGWTDLSYDRSMSFAVRNKIVDRICTTNEGKSGGLVFHHEQAQTPLWPRYIFFGCLQPALPGDGGETGLVRSDLVFDELKKRHPEFIAKCETHGVQYTVYAGATQDVGKGAGRSWKSFFHVDTKDECERKMKAGGWEWQWGVGPHGSQLSSDFLKCITPILEAVKVAPGDSRQRKCFFNQLIATTANALEFSRVGTHHGCGGYDPLKDVPTQSGINECVRFGNGDTVPLDILLEAKQICEEHAINVGWQQGDVALISNYLMMHARRPFVGSRKVVASLVAEENCTSFGRPLVTL